VDAGNWAETKNYEPMEKSEFIWDMMSRLKYDVVTPGDAELMYGESKVQSLYGKHPEIQVVSANITDKSGKQVWKEFTVVARGGVKIAVTGVTGASAYAFNVTRGMQQSDDFNFQDSQEALRRVIPEMRKQADLVVVLMHETPGDARRIVDEIPGMDVVIVGHNPGYMFNPDRVGNTLLVRSGNRGQYLSVLDLTMDKDKTVIDYTGEGKPLGNTVDREPTLDKITTDWETGFKEREQAAQKQDAIDKAMNQGTEKFLGAETCARCHADEYTAWSNGAHAAAVRKERSHDPAEVAEGIDIGNVQCEHCHGLGTFHGTPAMETQVSEETCRGCHEAEGAPPVNYADALAAGIHTK